MPRAIDYYFSMPSPWAYLGHVPFMGIVERHGLAVNYKPVPLGSVFAQTGGPPLPQRAPARQRYRLLGVPRRGGPRGGGF